MDIGRIVICNSNSLLLRPATAVAPLNLSPDKVDNSGGGRYATRLRDGGGVGSRLDKSAGRGEKYDVHSSSIVRPCRRFPVPPWHQSNRRLQKYYRPGRDVRVVREKLANLDANRLAVLLESEF